MRVDTGRMGGDGGKQADPIRDRYHLFTFNAQRPRVSRAGSGEAHRARLTTSPISPMV